MKYIICTPEQYKALNTAISEAKHYPDETGTSIYAPETPTLCKTNIEVDEKTNEIYDTMCVMPITIEVQTDYSNILDEYELVDSYVSIDTIEQPYT